MSDPTWVADGSSWLDMLSGSIQWCVDNRAVFAELDSEDQVRVRREVEVIATEVRAALGDVPNSWPEDAQRERLSDLYRNHSNRLGDPRWAVVVARGMAVGLGSALTDTMTRWFQSRGHLEIEAGKLHPVHRHDPRAYTGGHANTAPDRLPDDSLRSVPGWRLPRAGPDSCRLLLDWDLANRLGPLSRSVEAPDSLDTPLRFGVAQPNLGLEEFDSEFDYAARTFTNRGPSDDDRQSAILVAICEEAARADVDVLVVPEYCVGVKEREAMLGALGRLGRPTLVLGGSMLTEDDDGRPINEGILWAAGTKGPVASKPLRKLHRARIRESGDGGAVAAGAVRPRVECDELIDVSEKVIRVWMSQHWGVAALICADALSNEVIDALASVGTNLLLVGAMTGSTTSLRGQLRLLNTRSQAFTVLGNAPDTWAGSMPGREVAAFDGPYLEEVDGAVTGGSAEGPVLYVFDTVDGTVQHVAVALQ